MKNFIVISLAIIIGCCLFTACDTEEAKLKPTPVSLENAKTPLEKMAAHSSNKTYLQDFPTYLRPEIEKRKKAGPYFQVQLEASSEDVEALKKTYPQAKEALIELIREEKEENNILIQHIGLRYLRNLYLLKRNTPSHKSEIVFLLTEIMKTNPVDLDVIVDAMLRVEELLTEEQQKSYRRYVFDNINAREAASEAGLIETKQSFENATNDSQRLLAIIAGHHHKRAIQTFAYARGEMNFDVMD
jgi:hypothetical protein